MAEERVAALQHRKADLETALGEAEPGSEEHGALVDELADVERQIAGAEADVERARQESLEVAADASVANVVDGTAEEDEPEAPTGRELVIADPTDEHEVFVVLDRHDEDLIVAEMQRRLTKTLLYDFPQDGSRVVDLSIRGVRECIRLLNNTGKCKVTIDPRFVQFEETVEDGMPQVVCTAYAIDEVTGHGEFGTAAQPKRMKLKDSTAAKKRGRGEHVAEDGTVWDKFARQKALSKAQRNALSAHIPEGMRQTLIAQYKGDAETIRRIQAGAGAEAIAELPPPLTDERAVEQKARARELFSQLREIDPLKILPAQFHHNLSRAEHDHDRLEDFIGMLEGKLAEAQGAVA